MNLKIKKKLNNIKSILSFVIFSLTLNSCSEKISVYFGDCFDEYNTSLTYYTRFHSENKQIILQDSILKGNDVLGTSFWKKVRLKSKNNFFEIKAINKSFNRSIDTIIVFDKPKRKQKILIEFDHSVSIQNNKIKLVYLSKNFKFK